MKLDDVSGVFMRYRKMVFVLVGLLLIVSRVFAQSTDETTEKIFTQRLSWKKAQNVFEYKVIIEKVDSDFVQEFLTPDTFVDFSLPAGNYRYKIITLDFLGRESKSTTFKNFSITKAQRPKVTLPSEQVAFGYTESNELYISLPFERVSEASTVQIYNEDTNEIYTGSIKMDPQNNACTIYMPEIPTGKYYFVITDPSGLTGKSDIFAVTRKSGNYFLNKHREVTEDEQDQTVITEIIQDESDSLDFEQIKAEELEQQAESTQEQIVEENAEQTDLIEQNILETDEANKIESKKVFTVSAGATDWIIWKNQENFITFLDRENKKFIPMADGSFSMLNQKGTQNLGFEVNAYYKTLGFSNGQSKTDYHFFGSRFNLVYRASTKNGKFGINFKAGAGLANFGYGISFEDGTQSIDYENFNFLMAGGTVSLNFVPFRHFYAELGAEINTVFIPNSNFTFAKPFLRFGIEW